MCTTGSPGDRRHPTDQETGTAQLRATLFAAAISLAGASAVEAAGLRGGLAGLAVLAFLLLTPAAVLLLVLAFASRAGRKPKAARVLSGLSALMAAVLLLLGSSILNRPLTEGLNPWWSSDAAVVATVCLLLVLGNALLLARRPRHGVLAVLATAALVAVQFVFTPGRSIYYEDDPLTGEVATLRELDGRHAGWNDRVLRFEASYGRVYLSPQAAVEPNGDGKYTVTVSLPNDDPRLAPVGGHRSTRPGWAYRFPFQPSHVAVVVATNAAMLPEDWRADEGMLNEVVRSRASRDWIEEVIARGADPNHVDEDGVSPLLISALGPGGYRKNLFSLLELGADPNLRLRGGDTVLHRLARAAPPNRRLLASLIRFGADPTIRNDAGDTPLDIARRRDPRTPPMSP